MPMPLLWKMKLNARKKLMVMLMFGVGFFVTVISILRLHILVSYGKAANFSWDYVPLGYWVCRRDVNPSRASITLTVSTVQAGDPSRCFLRLYAGNEKLMRKSTTAYNHLSDESSNTSPTAPLVSRTHGQYQRRRHDCSIWLIRTYVTLDGLP